MEFAEFNIFHEKKTFRQSHYNETLRELRHTGVAQYELVALYYNLWMKLTTGRDTGCMYVCKDGWMDGCSI